ncbi:PqqD family protein [Desulfolutivibrio sulfoxidireducens]|uniref:PqqD family protein n=1 Tax=Desulfolutivibrio sulfoxidireducens TaxID=2773299 RepID=UPI00159E13D1|nr:PqqD family protein [Desulfolutivibrio sulfoxidireducens]QLA15646.1 PqqD family peptide modification chaperone [Desulfolutivibrio sulfoxidireducens]QLA19252.1 PqqD family peptide modification chaperone [Desulfolutivibrio sulfoxidireducens]
MSFFRKKQAPSGGMTRERALAFVPVKNVAVRQEITADGLVRLFYPVTVRPAFSGMLRRIGLWDGRPSTKTLELDRMGAATWELVDGKASAREVAAAFAARYSLGSREAEIAVAAFLRELGRRGVIGFREPEA